jgi:copper chaperone CopZ
LNILFKKVYTQPNENQYSLTGMGCDGCVNTVKHALLNIHDITEAEVLLQPQCAVLTMSKPVEIMELQAELSKKGNFTIQEALSK